MSVGMLGVVILAGGEGKRMGGQDKGWCQYNGQPFIEKVLQQLTQQAEQLNCPVQIVISANRNLEKYCALGYPVISDLREGFNGPLAGIEAALTYGQEHNIQQWISCPVDCLQLPPNYLSLMQLKHSAIQILQIDGRQHFAHMAIRKEVREDLHAYLDRGKRSIKGWLQTQEVVFQSITFESRVSDRNLLNCNDRQFEKIQKPA